MTKSAMDQFLEGIGNAVQDVREKAVEQAYFGQTVTDNIQPSVEAPETATPEPVKTNDKDMWQEFVKAGREPKEPGDSQRDDPGLDR